MTQPFNFSRLKKVSRREVDLVDGLLELLPRIGFTHSLKTSLEDVFEKYLGGDFSISLKDISTISFQEILEHLPEDGFYALIGLAPLKRKAILQLDPALARSAIDKMLGGSGDIDVSGKPLTNIDEGVLSYLLLKALAHIYESLGRSARLHFRLDQCERRRGAVASLYPVDEIVCMLTFGVSLGGLAGFVNLLLPSPFVAKAIVEPFSGEKVSREEDEYKDKRFGYFETVRTQLWGEIGRAVITGKEFSRIKPGDVVLLDETHSRFADGKIAGKIVLKVGDGSSPGLQAELTEVGKGKVGCKLLE